MIPRDYITEWRAQAHPNANPDRIITCFKNYMAHGGHHVTKREFVDNLHAKLADDGFTGDLAPILAIDQDMDWVSMADLVTEKLINRLA